MTPEEAKILLQKIAIDKDQLAFSALFEEFAPRVKAYMIKQGAAPDTAEDLAQDAMATVWNKAALYAPEKGGPSTWIFTIARNRRIDRFRRERAWQPLPEGHDEMPSTDPSPDDSLSEQERSQQVRAVLAELPKSQLEVINLAFLKGQSQSEIAEALKIPLGTVKSRMRLAYEKMRPLLDDLT